MNTMTTLEKDVAKLCDAALLTGRGVFTYATHLRVNLVYKTGEGWVIVGVLMAGPTTTLLGGDGEETVGLQMLADRIQQRLGSDLRFGTPELDRKYRAWIVKSTGGPKPTKTMEVDVEACERLVRYAKRDGRGEVTAEGWRLRLTKQGDWLLDVSHVDRTETRESLSTKHFALGLMEVAVARLLRQPVRVQKPSFEEADDQTAAP